MYSYEDRIRAVKLVDPACEVSVDIASCKVQVSSREDRAALVEALTESGYPPAACPPVGPARAGT